MTKSKSIEVRFLEQFVIKVDRKGLPTEAKNGKKITILDFADVLEGNSPEARKAQAAFENYDKVSAVEADKIEKWQEEIKKAKQRVEHAKELQFKNSAGFSTIFLEFAKGCENLEVFKEMCKKLEEYKGWGRGDGKVPAPRAYTQYKSDITAGWSKGLSPRGADVIELDEKTGKEVKKTVTFDKFGGKDGYKAMKNNVVKIGDKLMTKAAKPKPTPDYAEKVYKDLEGADKELAQDLRVITRVFVKGTVDDKERILQALSQLASELELEEQAEAAAKEA